MGLNYIIDCNHCGAHTEYRAATNRRTMSVSDANLSNHIDTQCAMRCPICRSRLNTTESEFRAQVKIIRMA